MKRKLIITIAILFMIYLIYEFYPLEIRFSEVDRIEVKEDIRRFDWWTITDEESSAINELGLTLTKEDFVHHYYIVSFEQPIKKITYFRSSESILTYGGVYKAKVTYEDGHVPNTVFLYKMEKLRIASE